MKKGLLLACLLVLSQPAIFGQNQIYYTINIGTFLDAKVEDFGALQSIGFLHARQLDGNLKQVFLGGYLDLPSAQRDLAAVRQAGYTSAYVQENFPANGRPTVVIQFATLSARQDIDWAQFKKLGTLYGMLNGDQLKLCVGIYENTNRARQVLPEVKDHGFRDAFVRTVNSIFLHEIAAFETGNAIKKPLIPIEINDNPPITPPSRPDDYGVNPNPGRKTRKAPPAISENTEAPGRPAAYGLPDIRGDQKRRSAVDLQSVLQQEGLYTGSLDGYYGPGTRSAYEAFINSDRNYQKYRILAANSPDVSRSAGDRLQRAINDLPNNSRGVEGFPHPVAKAYQAYVLFSNSGPSNRVNQLMNAAISEAYANTPRQMAPGFDFTATYAYNDLDQLINHLFNIHAAPAVSYTIPCWLSERHPQAVARASAPFLGSDRLAEMQSCDGFTRWEELQVLEKAAEEFLLDPKVDRAMLAKAATVRASLYLINEPLTEALSTELEQWHEQLWTNIESWARQDPMLQRDVATLKVAYFQAQVRLEDYFMDRDFRAREARSLALATIRSTVGYYLQRFTS